MMVDQTTLSVFNPNSRFDMIYEEFGFIPADEGAVSWTNQHGFDVRAEYVLEKPDVIFCWTEVQRLARAQALKTL